MHQFSPASTRSSRDRAKDWIDSLWFGPTLCISVVGTLPKRHAFWNRRSLDLTTAKSPSTYVTSSVLIFNVLPLSDMVSLGKVGQSLYISGQYRAKERQRYNTSLSSGYLKMNPSGTHCFIMQRSAQVYFFPAIRLLRNMWVILYF